MKGGRRPICGSELCEPALLLWSRARSCSLASFSLLPLHLPPTFFLSLSVSTFYFPFSSFLNPPLTFSFNITFLAFPFFFLSVSLAVFLPPLLFLFLLRVAADSGTATQLPEAQKASRAWGTLSDPVLRRLGRCHCPPPAHSSEGHRALHDGPIADTTPTCQSLSAFCVCFALGKALPLFPPKRGIRNYFGFLLEFFFFISGQRA